MIVHKRLSLRSSVCPDGYMLRCTAKAHARIIWDCAWMHEEDVFVTAGRDKQVSLCANMTSSVTFSLGQSVGNGYRSLRLQMCRNVKG